MNVTLAEKISVFSSLDIKVRIEFKDGCYKDGRIKRIQGDPIKYSVTKEATTFESVFCEKDVADINELLDMVTLAASRELILKELNGLRAKQEEPPLSEAELFPTLSVAS